jgi:hypothetical protein
MDGMGPIEGAREVTRMDISYLTSIPRAYGRNYLSSRRFPVMLALQASRAVPFCTYRGQTIRNARPGPKRSATLGANYYSVFQKD